ncbi:MAG: transcriptional regulator [DPANN group archaeon]|nr:transcriptional regulator [DPANN group archaeon]
MSIQKQGKRRQLPKIRTVSVRLPKIMVSWMDRLVARGLYNARAEIVREFTREHLDTRQAQLKDNN